ncbi:MAG: ADP-ribosylglycohydrolase family protein [Selenomonadaceae bacterium]|nr:ADP-ribosylglycohydrolase family protein [Selenomonadaceae bacterium]
MLTNENVKSALLGLAVGDALGVPVEFYSRYELKENPVTGMRSNGAWRQPIGTWSDDTSLTIAAMESIARLKKFDANDIMKNFVRWLKEDKFTANDETFDCGNTTGAAIDNFIAGAPPSSCGMNDVRSNGNGSLMRIFPAVFFAYKKAATIGDALDIVHELSALTHAHEYSLMGCGIYYFVAAQILDGNSNLTDAVNAGLRNAKNFYSAQNKFAESMKVYERIFSDDFAALPEDEIKSYGYVVPTLEAAIWCLLNTDSYKSAVLTAVNLGKDTDTVGAIAGGMAGLFYGTEQIPAAWLDVLKKRQYLENIANNFFAAL